MFHFKSSGPGLLGGMAWNLCAIVAPAAVAVATVPFLLSHLGPSRFGLLALGWVIVGYTSLFDFGLGRALTQFVAAERGRGSTEVGAAARTTLLLLACVGVIVAALLIVTGPLLLTDVLHLGDTQWSEAQTSLLLVAGTVPFVVISAGLRGILEGHRRFDLTNLVRIPNGVFTYAGPALVIPFSGGLAAAFAVLGITRALGCIAYALLVVRLDSRLLVRGEVRPGQILQIVRRASWMTVSNVVNPLMTYADRYLIANLLTLAAVSYYAAPYDLVTRLTVLSAAIAGVLFPAFAGAHAHTPGSAGHLYSSGLRYVLLLTFPIVAVTVTFAHDGLALWLGSDVAAHSTRVLQLLAYGAFCNALAAIPYALIQAIGRPAVTALVNLAELPLYLAAVVVLAPTLGIEGVAGAWAGRTFIDLGVLAVLGWRACGSSRLLLRRMMIGFGASTTAVALLASLLTTAGRAIVLTGVLGLFVFFAWRYLIGPQGRRMIRHAPMRAWAGLVRST